MGRMEMAVGNSRLDGTGRNTFSPLCFCLLIMNQTVGTTRKLIFVCPDQLNPDSHVLREADPDKDIIVMGESRAEATRFPFHIQRMTLIFSAMRHRAEALEQAGFQVDYHRITDEGADTLADVLLAAIKGHRPECILMTRPNRFDLIEAFEQVSEEAGVPLEYIEDIHFLTSPEEFKAWADGRKTLVMEHFYRAKRKETGYLMEGDQPAGGEWNFDGDNRQSFGKDGPGLKVEPLRFEPDAITRKTIQDLQSVLPDLPGSADSFGWPVTPEQAREALDHFIAHRLPDFGRWQDAMWTDEPWLFHSLISPAINLQLLDPRKAIKAAEKAYLAGKAPINAVEGFVRQILGWREFIRGIYWLEGPDYGNRNALGAERELPGFYWGEKTDMVCVSQVVSQVLEHGYAHHIQRLMVTGLYALVSGTDPWEIHRWYMGLFVDSYDWVTLPNTIGMSQFADGGVVGTKPYIASGQYVDRMSNYCASCRFNPKHASEEDACPITTLYWSFLMEHEDRLAANRRMKFQVANLGRKSPDDKAAILRRRDAWFDSISN
jgi:deoxyribodipyrimidine photolyase-related protein